jgi:Sialic acid synthase
MVKAIRNIDLAKGSYNKKITFSESKNIKFARKSIVASQDIKKGQKFSINNLTIKRPGNGISPMRWFKVLQMRAKKKFKKDDLIII